MRSVLFVQFIPSRGQLLSFSKDKILRIWDVQLQICLQRLSNIFPRGPEGKCHAFIREKQRSVTFKSLRRWIDCFSDNHQHRIRMRWYPRNVHCRSSLLSSLTSSEDIEHLSYRSEILEHRRTNEIRPSVSAVLSSDLTDVVFSCLNSLSHRSNRCSQLRNYSDERMLVWVTRCLSDRVSTLISSCILVRRRWDCHSDSSRALDTRLICDSVNESIDCQWINHDTPDSDGLSTTKREYQDTNNSRICTALTRHCFDNLRELSTDRKHRSSLEEWMGLLCSCQSWGTEPWDFQTRWSMGYSP